MDQNLINILRGIHRELIVSNWNTKTQKEKQRKLFNLLDVVDLAQDEKTKKEFINEIAKLTSQGFVRG